MKIIQIALLVAATAATTFPMSAKALSTSTSSSAATQKLSGLSLGATAMRDLVKSAARDNVSQTLDINGIAWMEHINLVVGSKLLAQYFYVEFLGLTVDASKSFHVNLGQQQFHLAENGDPPQRIAGSIGLVVPSLETLRERMAAAREVLAETQFSILVDDVDAGYMTLICPWGNRMHVYSIVDDCLESSLDSPQKMVNLHAEGGSYGPHRMAVRGNPGIRYVEVACRKGSTHAIAQFYREILGCTVFETPRDETIHSSAVVCVGPGVHLAFCENENLSEDDITAMEGVHICFYANDFEGLFNKLYSRNLIWTNPRFTHLDSCDTWEEALASRTLRFKNVIDLLTEKTILELEHETRPLSHGQYMKVTKYEPK